MKEINLPFLSSKKETGASGNQPNGNGVSGKTVKPAVFSKIDPLDVKKKLNQRRPLILVLITILILSVTVFRQTLLKVISLSQENIKKGDKLEKVTTKANYLYALDVNQLEVRVREMEQVFPSRKPSLQLLVMLKLLAFDNNVSLGSLTLQPGKLESEDEEKALRDTDASEKKMMEDFLVDFSVIGTSNNISNFIQALKNTAPLTQIEKVGVSIVNEVNNNYILRVSLSARVYYQSLPEQIPNVDDPLAQLTVYEEEVLNKLADFEYYPLIELPGGFSGKENLFSQPSQTFIDVDLLEEE